MSTTIAQTSTPDEAALERAGELFRERETDLHRRTDRLFAYLLVAQWVFAIAIAVTISPYAWTGKVRAIHAHVPMAIFGGGLLTAFPTFLALSRPGAPSTRYVIAVAQMLWSALLIHLTGGRIETHFHVFGSLAFLSVYRDYRVFFPATVVVVIDHVLRQALWPESAFGTTTPEAWRFLEHAGWVLFEDAFLVIACISARKEMYAAAVRQAQVESLSRLDQAKTIELDTALRELEASQVAQLRSERLAVLGKLAASMGHELRNPLAAVRNANAYVARRVLGGNETPWDPKVAQFFAIIDKEIGACGKIISDLLDFARGREPTRAPCPLRPVVDDAFSVIPTKVALENAVPEDLPVLDLDRDQMRQVVINLVQNAVEAMPETRMATARVVVSARTLPSGGYVLEVRDNAGGIPDDVASRIFEPLFTTKTTGTGLGLAIVASMVERHGGKIRVDSQLGEGSCFSIELPRDRAAIATAALMQGGA
jgi:two-component system, NtrC family, sensor histidine kinase HydH